MSKDNNIELKETEERIDITFADILYLSSGIDEDTNYPKAGGLISVDEIINEESSKIIDNAPMDCEFNIFCEGGAVVLQCDFSNEFKHEINLITNLCDSYVYAKRENPSKEWILNLVVTPLELEGLINIIFMGFVYYAVDNDNNRLILVFDNTLTEVVCAEGIDFASIKAEIDAELIREEKELEDEIYEAQMEIDRLQKFNPYEDEIKNQFLADEDDSEEGTDTTRGDYYEED